MIDPRGFRSLLFLPASNPRAIEKARTLDADLVILDLEDAVKPEDKATARRAAVDAVRTGFGGHAVAIRVNAIGTDHYGEDVVAIRQAEADFIVVPKVEDEGDIHDTHSLYDRPILAMIETARGVVNVQTIAARSAGLIAGVNDLAVDLGIPAGAGRSGLSLSLQSIVLAARAARIAAFDGVYNRLDDAEGLERECIEGRACGFDGKSLIHPGQIEACNRIFGPSANDVRDAERLVAAATGGAERFEGRMIEAMHVDQARAVLARAGRLSGDGGAH